MDVRCEKCSTEYEFDEDRIGANGVTVKCTACGFVFKVKRPRRSVSGRSTTTLGRGPQGREWLVRKPDGQMIAFRELTTLQKWIVEGRIQRDDEISKNGETWKRLGNILELEPFFSVYEKARALNELIERGAVEGQRIEIRGSEVLAAMNPIATLQLEANRPEGMGPSGLTHAQSPQAASAFGAEPPLSGAPVPDAHPPAGPTMLPGTPIVLPGPAPAGTPPNGGLTIIGDGNFGGPTGSMRALAPGATGDVPPWAGTPVDAEPPTPAGTLGAAPPAEDLAASGRGRGSFADARFSIPLDDVGGPASRTDIVARFKRQQRNRNLLLASAALALVGIGGVLFAAKYGPAGNPIRALAQRYGLLEPHAEDDGANASVEEAQRALDLDTLTSLERAQRLLESAQRVRGHDPAVRADRALALVVAAEQLRRIAADEETAVADGTAKDAAKMKEDAVQKEQAASRTIKDAFEAARAAFDLAPDAVEPLRALAEYYRVQRDTRSYHRELALAKAALERSRATDSTLLYTEAAAARNLDSPPNEDNAIQLLEQALTTRPTMNRARVLLARIYLGRQDLSLAKLQLERVLESAPDHQEAAFLRATLLALERKGSAAHQPTSTAPLAPASPGAGGASATATAGASGVSPGGGGKTPGRATTPGAPAGAAPTPGTTGANAPSSTPAPSTPAPSAPAPNGIADAALGGPESLDLKSPKGRAHAFLVFMQLADRQRNHDHPRQALATYERAADIRPGAAEALTGMGWAYIDLNKPEAALNVFRRALRVNDRYADAYYGEAEAHRMLGQRPQAIEYYQKYLGLAPNGTERKAAQHQLEILNQQ